MNPRILFAAALLAVAIPVAAQPFIPGAPRPDASATVDTGARTGLPPDAVLAQSGKAKVTRADYDIELTRLPPEMRGGFATTEKRVADLLTRMLVTKELALQAEETGIAREPNNAARLASELERAKAQLRLAQIDAESGAQFERERATFEKRAREVYATQAQRYSTSETVTASHILFLTTKHTPEEAMALAQEARARIVAGAPFARVAAEVSEDLGTRKSNGRLPPFTRGQMDPAFEKAAFALEPGKLSEPVESKFGVHLILVHVHEPAKRRSYEEVAPEIMATLRDQYIGAQREQVMATLSEQARAGVNQDVLKLFVIDRPSEQELIRIQRDAAEKAREFRKGKN